MKSVLLDLTNRALRLTLWTAPVWLYFLLSDWVATVAIAISGNGQLAPAAVILTPALLWPIAAFFVATGMVNGMIIRFITVGLLISSAIGAWTEFDRLNDYNWFVFDPFPFLDRAKSAILYIDLYSFTACTFALFVGALTLRMATQFAAVGTRFNDQVWRPMREQYGRIFKPRSKDYRRANSAVFGSAEWWSLNDARVRLSAGELILGEATEPNSKKRRHGDAELLRYDGSGHLLTVAGSGAGKSVSVAMPNLLSYSGPVFVLDVKNELAPITRKHRQTALGRQVFVLDPSNEHSPGFNVMDWLDPTKDKIIDDTRLIATWLVGDAINSDKGDGKYWIETGRDLLHCILLDVVFDPALSDDQRTLMEVRNRISSGVRACLERIMEQDQNYAFGAAQQLAGPMLEMAEGSEKQFAGVQGEAVRATRFMISPSNARLVTGSAFKTADLAEGRIDIFLALSIDQLQTDPALARVIIGAFLSSIQRRNGYIPKRVLFLLDEMPRLGKMAFLETARDAGRSYGVTLWAIVQDLGQLDRIYGKEGRQSWLESTAVHQFFGINSIETAELVSKTIGETTAEFETESENRGGSRRGSQLVGTVNDGRAQNRNYTRRRLMTPDEVLHMATDVDGNPAEQIIFVRSAKGALRCGLAKYYRRHDMKLKADENLNYRS